MTPSVVDLVDITDVKLEIGRGTERDGRVIAIDALILGGVTDSCALPLWLLIGCITGGVAVG